MSSAAIALVKITRKCSQKVAHFGSLGWIPMIQGLFIMALQYYETGMELTADM